MLTVKEIKERFAPDQKAQEAVWVHGCNLKQISIIEGMIQNNLKAEICTTKISDPVHFQNFGILVKGHVTLMAKSDIGSKYDAETRERVFFVHEGMPLERIFTTDYDELQNDNNSYTESFVIPEEIVGVYVMDYMLERKSKFDQRNIERLKALGYPLTIIKSK